MARQPRFTVYDVMDAKGYFDSNPANAGARDVDGNAIFTGPVEFPKMMFHPTGATRQTVPPEILMTPYGPKEVGEQRELINRIVKDKKEEGEALAEGWHLHPAGAQRAGGKEVGPVTEAERIAALEAEIVRLRATQSVASQPTSEAPIPTKFHS